MIRFNPANYLVVAILGVALLWAARLIYGGRREAGEDGLKRLLLLAGWTSVVAGMLGLTIGLFEPWEIARRWWPWPSSNMLVFDHVWLLLPLPILGLTVLVVTYFRYMAAERRALLWALAVAAEKGIPLAQAARAFAEERSFQIGGRVSRLADLLESGVPLPAALGYSRNALAADALLAVRVGAETGQLGQALRMSLEYNDRFDRAMRELMSRYLYVVCLLGVGSIPISVVMLWIVPMWRRIFEEFNLRLPSLTEHVIAISNNVGVFVFLYALLALLLLATLSYYVRWSRYELPVLNRLWWRCDSALVMRALALAVRQQRELGPTMVMLSEQYPYPSVRRRLWRAGARIYKGADWCDALRSAGLLTVADVGLLKSAERVGNLAWALEEMSDSAIRRLALRLRVALSIGFPLIILACGCLVFAMAAGMFLPMISLIQGLS